MFSKKLIDKLKQSLRTGILLKTVVDEATEYKFRFSGLDHWNVVEITPTRNSEPSIKLFMRLIDNEFYYSVLVNDDFMTLTEEQFDRYLLPTINYSNKKQLLVALTQVFENHLEVDEVIPNIVSILSNNRGIEYPVDHETIFFSSTIVTNKLIFRWLKTDYYNSFYLFFLLRSSGALELTINKLAPRDKWYDTNRIIDFLNKDFYQLLAQWTKSLTT